MSCPTCDHTMQGIGYGMFHCPRCGTLTNCPTDGHVSVPALVERCRAFGGGLVREPRDVHTGKEVFDGLKRMWHALGIVEAIKE